MAAGPDPLVDEDGHVLAGDGEDGLGERVSVDHHVGPGGGAVGRLGSGGSEGELLVQHLGKHNNYSGCKYRTVGTVRYLTIQSTVGKLEKKHCFH